MEACRGLRQATLPIDYAPTQVAPTRRCSGVAMFDSQRRSVVSASVIGNLTDHGWWQTEVLFWGLSAFARHNPLSSQPLVASWLVSRPFSALCLRILVTPTERVAAVFSTRV